MEKYIIEKEFFLIAISTLDWNEFFNICDKYGSEGIIAFGKIRGAHGGTSILYQLYKNKECKKLRRV